MYAIRSYYEKEVESGERIVVGVNKYQSDEAEYSDLLKIDEKVQNEQIKFLKRIKNERNNTDVKEKLDKLKEIAATDDNLIPYISYNFV